MIIPFTRIIQDRASGMGAAGNSYSRLDYIVYTGYNNEGIFESDIHVRRNQFAMGYINRSNTVYMGRYTSEYGPRLLSTCDSELQYTSASGPAITVYDILALLGKVQ